ncbi:MGDG synthase family glycosyltransferase [Clostridium sp.]|uniref:MGDG synthase family glycosyltransferase n=1 Tax=Clostridium sp. TaxID=1506 RepID=UPI002FC9002C
MKKVLIITTSTGQGHNQAANSLINVFEKDGYSCIKYDFLDNSSKFLTDAIVGGYEVSAMKFPGIYGFFYRLTNVRCINALSMTIFQLVKKRLKNLIDREKPDLIISTHPISVSIMNSLKKHGLKIPYMVVTTDFKAHYTYIGKYVDAYITGSEYTKQSLIKKGIKEDIIFPYGIPIKESFFERDENIPHIKTNEYFNILLMSGSMGLEDISYVLDELLQNKNKLRITVVCGNNKSLKTDLTNRCSKEFKNKKLHILGFSNDIASFMEYSDIIISKPGGLTVTESIAKNLPLIIPFAIPGQEQENTEFLSKEGYAICINNISDINQTINSLIENPDKLNVMRNKLKTLASTYSISSIVKLADKLVKKD